MVTEEDFKKIDEMYEQEMQEAQEQIRSAASREECRKMLEELFDNYKAYDVQAEEQLDMAGMLVMERMNGNTLFHDLVLGILKHIGVQDEA